MMTELRRRAEDQMRKQLKAGAKNPGPKTRGPEEQADPKRSLHELQVHQIELELQNDELALARDRMEAQLERQTELYDFAPVGYFSLDEAGRIMEVNLTGATLLCLERSRLIHRCLQTFLAPSSRSDFLAYLKRVFAGSGKQTYEMPLVMADGVIVWADLQAVVAVSTKEGRQWCRVTVSDITPLKQAEEKLHRSEALFSTLIEKAPVGVFVVDDQLCMRQVNPTALPAFSKVRPLVGRDLSETLHILWSKKVAEEILGRFRETLRTGKPYIESEFTERRRDSRTTESYEWRIQRILMPTGKHGVVCFFSDITARKQAETDAQRLAVLAASNLKLEEEIVRRKSSEQALKESELRQRAMAGRAIEMQGQLRHLSRHILKAQEDERKRISRELHDEIAQTLVGINIHLEALARVAEVDPLALKRHIAGTQKAVSEAVDAVHRFARDLRPTLLDDLGLIPALHAYMKEFTERTKVRIHFTAIAGVEQLSSARRTVLYRVAQSALTNIAQHAHATKVEAVIDRVPGAIRMEIRDNGRSFDVEQVLFAKRHKRLGLIGTRERVEMVGGFFSIESVPGKGTTIRAEIPVGTLSAAKTGAPVKEEL